MDKSTKQIRSKYNSSITKSLAVKYNISERYVRMIISNERSPDNQEQIIKDYNKMIRKINNALNPILKQTTL